MSGLFPNAWYVARREYRQRVRGRTFWVVTALLAAAGLAIGLFPVIGRLIEGDATRTLAVHSTDGELQSATATAIDLLLDAPVGPGGEAPSHAIEPVADPEAARERVRSGDLDGLLTVERGSDGDLRFELFTDASVADPWLVAVRQAATQVTIGDRLERAGVDPGQAGEIFAPTAFEVASADPDAREEEAFGSSYLLSNALVILTFMAIVTYGAWVATSVAEEKSSRVMELLITAASPRQLLAGKVLGNGAAGLTQYVVVIGAVLAGVLLQSVIAERLFGEGGGAPMEQLDLVVLLPFGVLFVPAFMLYCTLYAGLGSLASRQEDVTQVTGPMLFVGMGGYFTAFVAMATPDAPWIKVLSVIPFFSPYLLPTRYLLGSGVAWWEWLLAGGLMVVFLLGALWVAARIYSAGVLLYGQRPTLRSAWKAVRVNR